MTPRSRVFLRRRPRARPTRADKQREPGHPCMTRRHNSPAAPNNDTGAAFMIHTALAEAQLHSVAARASLQQCKVEQSYSARATELLRSNAGRPACSQNPLVLDGSRERDILNVKVC